MKGKNMNKIKFLVASAFIVLGVGTLSFLQTSPVYAADAAKEILKGANTTGQTSSPTLEDRLTTITNVLLFIIGAVAVVVIIIGGLRYVTSAGDAGQTKGAKDTILYAVVGLIIAIIAYAIVRFVINAFT
jgi:hypothetical protein